MTEADFDFLRQLLHLRSGLSLSAEKRYLAESRLGILCRRRAIDGLGTLVRQLAAAAPTSRSKGAVVEAMTTNETLFFRDQTPFDLFRTVILPEKLAANAATRSLRIWCAAVSTGQEAYSLAMILDEMAARLAGWKVEIVGTDISSDVLERARAGALQPVRDPARPADPDAAEAFPRRTATNGGSRSGCAPWSS